MRSRFAPAALGALLSSACLGSLSGGAAADNPMCAGKADVGHARSAIIAGSTTSEFAAMGFLADASGQAFCTATLVGSDIAVTAAHCLVEGGVDFFGLGASTSAPTAMIRVASSMTHPQYDDAELTYDIGFVRLAEAAPVAPIPIRFTPVSPGDPITVAGYGEDDGSRHTGFGIARKTIVTVSSLETTSWVYTDYATGHCYGDSGGPGFDMSSGSPVLVGINSGGVNDDCTGGGTDTRLDPFQAFLPAEVLTTTSSPEPTPGCEDSCASARNGVCEDGGIDAASGVCAYGADCADCGARTPMPAPTPGCSESCASARNGICEDGGAGASAASCAFGSDCADCGDRTGMAVPTPMPTTMCADTCAWAHDGVCDDGGPGAECSACAYGTDCGDCGAR
ncbi:MAG: trypsin-like serine protease [Sandaracinaceae bacterium]